MRYLSVLCSISLSVERVETPHVIFYTENQIIHLRSESLLTVRPCAHTYTSLPDSRYITMSTLYCTVNISLLLLLLSHAPRAVLLTAFVRICLRISCHKVALYYSLYLFSLIIVFRIHLECWKSIDFCTRNIDIGPIRKSENAELFDEFLFPFYKE